MAELSLRITLLDLTKSHDTLTDCVCQTVDHSSIIGRMVDVAPDEHGLSLGYHSGEWHHDDMMMNTSSGFMSFITTLA